MLQIENITQNQTLIDNGRVANNPLSRFRGLMGVRSLKRGEGLLIEPCDNVHTHFMRIPIDVIYVDAEHRVVHIDPVMLPWRIGRRQPKARYVIETPSGGAAASNTKVGDQLKLVVS